MKPSLCRCLVALNIVVTGWVTLTADTFTVTRTNATGPGSLPVIINQANATPGENFIEFAVTEPIVLVSPLPAIANSLTINGRSDAQTVISGGGTVPIFKFAQGTTNILSHLVLTNGYSTSSGAAIHNSGNLFISGCKLMGNHAAASTGIGSGGAITNSGTLTVVGSSMSGNSAATGGAVANSGSMNISSSSIFGNSAGNGGGIDNKGIAEIKNSTLSGNQAWLGFGGAILNSSNLTVFSSTIHDNLAHGIPGQNGLSGGGGGGGLGGGVFSAFGLLSMTNCTLAGNAAIGGTGGNATTGTGNAYNNFTVGANGGGNNAGSGAHLGLSDSVAGGLGGGGGSGCFNAAAASGGFGGGGGGGAFRDGGLDGLLAIYGGGSLFAGGAGGVGWYSGTKWGGGGGGGGAALGAGAFIESGSVTFVNCTLTENSCSQGPGGQSAGPYPQNAGYLGNAIAGGIFNHNGTVSLANTIVAGNSAEATRPELYGAFLSRGFNLIGDNQGAPGLSVNDFQNVPASLGPLQDNGGPTLTCALLQGSLAIGAGTSVGAPSTDQREVARPPNKYDIGAFQLVTVITPTIQWPQPSDIVYGTPLGSSQLNATVGVAGTIAYAPPAGTVLSAVQHQVLQVVFTPSDPIQYTSATNSVSINVLKANQSLSFAPIPNHQIGDPPILLNASASSGLPVIFKVQSGPATITGNLLSFGSSDGQVTIAAIQNGDNNHEPIEADQSLYLGTIPLPLITTQPVSQSVYPGDRVAFTVSAANGPLNYQWQFFGAVIPGGTRPTLVLARVQAAQAGPYRVIVTNPAGSITSLMANLTVIVSQGTARIVRQPQGQIIRIGESVTISVLATGDGPLSYQWYRGQSGDTSGIIPGATDSSYTASGLSNNTAFWVTVRNSFGAVDSATADLRVSPANAARLGLNVVSGMPGLVIEGALGSIYRVEYATDLKTANWSRLIDLSLSASPFTFIDSGAPNDKARFYRVLVP